MVQHISWVDVTVADSEFVQMRHGIGQLNPDLKPTVLKLAASKLPAFVESDVTRSNGLGWMTDGRWGHLLKQLQAVGEISETEAGSIGRLFVNPSAKSPGGF